VTKASLLRALSFVVKMASLAGGLSAYSNLIPEKYGPAAVVAFGIASIVKDGANRFEDLINKAPVGKVAATVVLGMSIFLAACSTTEQAKVNAFVASPTGQTITKTLASAIISAGVSAAGQYAGTGTVDPQKLVGDTLYGSSAQLYSLVGTPAASNPAAIQNAVQQGGGVPAVTKTVAPVVSANVTAAIQQGIPPDVAVAKAADALSTVAEQTTASSATP
jgi:hypothetical protein